MIPVRRFAIALSLVLCAAAAAKAPAIKATREGKVIGVTDGDTVTVLVEKKPVKVRLEGIDAPEAKQAYGAKAKRHLSALAFGKECSVQATGRDRYGRVLGYLLVAGEDVNERMVAEGFAWHFQKYNDEPRFTAAEASAREAGAGLWGDESPIAPWEWRALSPEERAARESGRGEPAVEVAAVVEGEPEATHWLNPKSGVRHNRSCRWFGTTKGGRPCTPEEGDACDQCGG
jgi:micrococcal nuclease